MRIRKVPAIKELTVGVQLNMNPASHSLAVKRHETNPDTSTPELSNHNCTDETKHRPQSQTLKTLPSGCLYVR